MDITRLYYACVKAAKVKGKALSPDRILPTTKKEKKENADSFHQQAMEVVKSISKLRDYLLSCQTEYLGEFSPLSSISSKMTEDERQRIEKDAQTVLSSCSTAIANLKSQVESYRLDDQEKAHSLVVLEILNGYLKEICKLYSQQRAFRVRQAVELKRISRLKPEGGYAKSSEEKLETNNVRKREIEKQVDIKPADQLSRKIKESLAPQEGLGSVSHLQNIDLLQERKPASIEFSQEETQMFEEENEHLYQEMNNIVKEVKNIEGKVVAIGKLQEIFQEKVLSQSDQIENINETTVSTTENVKEGNENIREAIKNSASFRVWILFFLVMCTFSLLFLDWYNE